MFGYIGVNKEELKIKDYNTYRAYYCGVCHALQKMSGLKGRLVLSFDMTFLAMLLDSLYDEVSRPEKKRCAPHSIKKQDVFVGEAVNYAAEMNILLAFDNLQDKWYDSKNLPAKALAGLIKKSRNRIAAKYPVQSSAVNAYIKVLRKIEKKKDANPYEAAEATGVMLGNIFAWKKDEWHDDLYELGVNLGRFIYMADAYDDYNKDIKTGSYNPFVRLLNENPGKSLKSIGEKILTNCASLAAVRYERLPVDKNMDILRNILYSGIWVKVNKNE